MVLRRRRHRSAADKGCGGLRLVAARTLSQGENLAIGGSWGSQLLTMLARDYPEHIAAAVCFGQVVDGELNEKISYEFALNAAREAGDQKSVDKLRQVGPPVMGEYRGGFKGLMVQRRVMMKYGGYSQSDKKRSYARAMVIPILKSESTLSDLYGYVKGYKTVLSAMWHEVAHVKFPETHTIFTVPFFIFNGRHDMNTPAELVQDWFDKTEAPRRSFDCSKFLVQPGGR